MSLARSLSSFRLLLSMVAIALGCAAPFLAVGPSRVHAQDGSAYEQAVRRALMEYEQGNWEESRALFRQAHGLNPNARTWRGLGISAFELRQYVNAINELEAALADSRKPLTLDQRADAQRLVGQARDFVSIYRLKVTPADAQILVDGAVALPKDGKLYVDPGSHWLMFRAAEHQERRLDVRLEAGTEQELIVALSPQPEPGEAANAAPTAKKRRFWTWVLGGATVAAGATSLGLGFGVRRSVNDNDECVAAGQFNCAAIRDRGQSLALATNIVAGMTGALAIGTVIALVVEGRSNEQPKQTSLYLRPDGIGLVGTF